MSAHMADLSISQGTVSCISVFSKRFLSTREVLLCMMRVLPCVKHAPFAFGLLLPETNSTRPL